MPVIHETGLITAPVPVYFETFAPAAVTGRATIVMVHGGAHSGACYQRTADGRRGWAYLFAERGYRSVVPDWPGTGRSGYIPLDRLNGATVMEGLGALIRGLGTPVILMTHSMSGCYGWRLLELHGDIIDRLVGVVGVCGRSGRFAEPRTGRSEPGEAATAIDEPHVAVVEAHDMVAGLEFGDAQELASQYFADEETVTFPHDLARGTHAADLVIGVVPRVLNAIRHGSLRWHVEFVRGSLAQRFVRALLVVVPAEGVEAGLLFGRVRRGWARRLCLERAMHALMSAILLRRGRMDEVGLAAELDPPRRQARKPPAPLDPNGAPLSQRIESGRP